MVLQNAATVVAVAIALGADAFSVALGTGISGASSWFKTRFVGSVALLHVFMPLLGLQLGLTAGKLLGTWASWVGALVLVYVGYNMIREGRKDTKGYSFSEARKTFFTESRPEVSRQSAGLGALVVMAISVSIDALTVGFSLGTAQVPIPLTVIVMGITAGLMTAAGFLGGRYVGRAVGNRAQMVGGGILFILAIKMVV